jgi:hypothetical protein
METAPQLAVPAVPVGLGVDTPRAGSGQIVRGGLRHLTPSGSIEARDVVEDRASAPHPQHDEQ